LLQEAYAVSLSELQNHGRPFTSLCSVLCIHMSSRHRRSPATLMRSRATNRRAYWASYEVES
jgi:hypothetical protein